MNPVRIIVAALKALDAEDETHRTIDIEAVESECQRKLGGCRCEREAKRAGVCDVKAEVVHTPAKDFCHIEVMRDSGVEDGDGDTIERAYGQLAES